MSKNSDTELAHLAPYKLRVRGPELGKHVHVTVFSRQHHSGETFACCGELTFDRDEWLNVILPSPLVTSPLVILDAPPHLL